MKKSLVKALVLSGLLVGCAGGGNTNSQGTSFAALGFFGLDDQGVCETAGTNVLSTYAFNRTFSASQVSCIGFRNNMTTQGVRLNTVELSYQIPGSLIQPPTTSVAAGALFGVAGSAASSTPTTATNTGPTSDLPASFQNIPVQIILPFTHLAPETQQWLFENRGSLPVAPFQMTVIARGHGVTTGEDNISSNEVYAQIIVTGAGFVPTATPTPASLVSEEEL